MTEDTPIPQSEFGISNLIRAWLNYQQFQVGDKLHNIIVTEPIGFGDRDPGISTEEAISPNSELLLACEYVQFGQKTDRGQMIQAVTVPWRMILRELESNPEFLFEYAKHSRKLEELIAAAYKESGYSDVVLTPRSGDGGVDVFATLPGFHSIRVVDQAKAFSSQHKVPANDVRSLLGVLDIQKNISKGVITTTSLFAPGVEDEFKEFIPHRIELVDGPRLLELLKEVARKK